MPPLIKTVLIVFIVMGSVILPFYLWNLIDRKSYEDFLLKGVSPLSRESRNEILRQRGDEPWFKKYEKKRCHIIVHHDTSYVCVMYITYDVHWFTSFWIIFDHDVYYCTSHVMYITHHDVSWFRITVHHDVENDAHHVTSSWLMCINVHWCTLMYINVHQMMYINAH